MELALIAAVAANGVIGCGNAIPWHVPGEQARFRDATWGHSLIMGRKTWQSLGRPLPGRHNVVTTRSLDFKAEGCEVVHSLAEGIAAAERRQSSRLFVIGGEQLYRLAMDRADLLILTRIEQEFAGDVFFPSFSCPPFQLMETERVSGPVPYAIETYRRIDRH